MFIDRMSSVLGIHPSYVKIVKVWKGSVWINFVIEVDGDDPVTVAELKHKLDQAIKDNNSVFGAPILNVEIETTIPEGVDIPEFEDQEDGNKE